MKPRRPGEQRGAGRVTGKRLGDRELLEGRMQFLNMKGRNEWSTIGTIYGDDDSELCS